MALISYTETLVALDVKYEDEEHGIMGDFFVNHPELGSVIQTQIIALDAEYSASVRKRRVEQEQCIARLGLDNLDGIASVFARVQKEIDNLRGRHHSRVEGALPHHLRSTYQEDCEQPLARGPVKRYPEELTALHKSFGLDELDRKIRVKLQRQGKPAVLKSR